MLSNKFFLRKLFLVVWLVFARWTPRILNPWRILLLRLFGAKISNGCVVYSSARIWAPWNLSMGKQSCIGPRVDVYNVGRILLEENVLISQDTYLCSASHNFRDQSFMLTVDDILIKKNTWVCAKCIILPGVNLAENTVIGAGAVVSKSTEPGKIYAGNPCREVGVR